MVLGIALPAAFTAAIAWYVWSEREQLEPLANAPIVELLAMSALVVIAHFLNSTEFWLLYRAQGARSSVIENWMLFLAGNLANYLPGQPGAVYRLRYMRVVHSVPYSHTAAVYGANLIATLGGAAAAGLTGTLGLASTTEVAPPMVIVYVGLAALAIVLVHAPLPAMLARSGKVARAWRAFGAGFEQVRRSPKVTAAIVAMEAMKYVATATRFQIAFSLLDIEHPFFFYLALAPAAGIAQFISFTPGAIGIREAFIAAAAVGLGSPLAAGLLAATVDRAVLFATAAVLGGASFVATYPTLRRAARADASSSA